jgi:hypothetical protein
MKLALHPSAFHKFECLVGCMVGLGLLLLRPVVNLLIDSHIHGHGHANPNLWDQPRSCSLRGLGFRVWC